MVLLLFVVGLETPFAALRSVGASALSVGTFGVVVPFAGGFVLLSAMGRDPSHALFMGVALVATSVGITARVLADVGALRRLEARVILGAAVVDDVLAMLALATVSAVALGNVSPLQIGLLVAEALAFVALLAVVGRRVARRYQRFLEHWFPARDPLVVAFILVLGLSALATIVGLAAIIGAFLAGMVLAEANERYNLDRRIAPAGELLVPFFFVVTGAHVDPAVFVRPETLGLLAAVTLVAVATKIVGCGLPALPLGRRGALLVGVGMVPRGEIGFIVASLGLAAGILDADLYSVVIGMSILTTVLTPPVLVRLLGPQMVRAPVHPLSGHAAIGIGEEEEAGNS